MTSPRQLAAPSLNSVPADVAAGLSRLDAASPLYATQLVEALLAAAVEAGASDVHLHPTPDGLAVRWRIDGVLQLLGEFPRGQAADVVARLKVLAELLTYRTDVPQEGRIRNQGLVLVASARSATPSRPSGVITPSPPHPLSHSLVKEGVRGRVGEGEKTAPSRCVVEMRVSTFPTLHGERAVVRLFAGEQRYLYLEDLGLATEVEAALSRLLDETSGAILLTGPAGSGKTTTAYACLREVVRRTGDQRSIVTLEDPIEVALPGVSQSQVQPAAGFTLATGLRSLMRQDPEVILVGEIRDAETVATVFQAALTGHLVLSTFHAGSAAGAVSRLLEMGLEPYLVTSGLRAVMHQRLVRRLCACRSATAGWPSSGVSPAVPNVAGSMPGCPLCRHTGYRGRLALAEMLPSLAGELGQSVLARADLAALGRQAVAAGMTTVAQRASVAVAAGQTDAAEVRRVLGAWDELSAGG